MDQETPKPDEMKTLLDRIVRMEAETAALKLAAMQVASSVATQVGGVTGQLSALASRVRPDHPLRPFFIGEVTAEASNKVAFKEKYVTDSGLVDFASGRVVTDETGDFAANVLPSSMGILFAYNVPGGVRYAFFRGGGSAVVVRVDTAATGGGFYNGVIMEPPASDVPGSSNLAAADIGTAGESCLIENMMEVGQATHDLTDAANTYQFYFIGHIRRTNEDGTKVVAINGFFTGCEAV